MNSTMRQSAAVIFARTSSLQREPSPVLVRAVSGSRTGAIITSWHQS
jgi:hypothetical protein